MLYILCIVYFILCNMYHITNYTLTCYIIHYISCYILYIMFNYIMYTACFISHIYIYIYIEALKLLFRILSHQVDSQFLT